MANIELRQVCKKYDSTEIIKDLDLTIHDKEFTVFVGPSGCGKSTLLRLIAGLEEITSGDLSIDGKRVNDVPAAKRGLALVFQSYALYPHMNVAENMSFSLKLAGISKDQREKKVQEAARILNIGPLLERKPKELSGGQRQRVAIGRAIVRNPKVFLFDEPLSNLDAALRVRMRQELTKLHRELSATMVYVTHDQVEAMTMADRIVVLQGGVIEQVGSPMELYRSPKNMFVAGFIGSPKMNFLPATVVHSGSAGIALRVGDNELLYDAGNSSIAKAGEQMTVGVRPEHIRLHASSGLPVQVLTVEHLGSESYVQLQTNSGELVMTRVNGETDVRVEQRLHLELDTTHLHLFDAQGEAIPRRPSRSVPTGTSY